MSTRRPTPRTDRSCAGDGQAETPPAGPTKADPDICQAIARLEKAISSGNRELLRAAGGFDKAADRLSLLRKLPDGTPTTEQRRAAIDRYSIWGTIRLIGGSTARLRVAEPTA